jgi:hypothetical protein
MIPGDIIGFAIQIQAKLNLWTIVSFVAILLLLSFLKIIVKNKFKN